MTFDWGEYLAIAEELAGQTASGAASGAPASEEARSRAAVSRAYYAVFGVARERLRQVDQPDTFLRGNPHRLVAAAYQGSGDPRLQRIGAELDVLRVRRNQCDYDASVHDLEFVMQRSLASAATLLRDLAVV